MKRGDIVVMSVGGLAGKPRPGVIVQSDAFGGPNVTVCPLTTELASSPLIRVPVAASNTSGLKLPSEAMLDRIVTAPRTKITLTIGSVSQTEMTAISRGLAAFLGMAD